MDNVLQDLQLEEIIRNSAQNASIGVVIKMMYETKGLHQDAVSLTLDDIEQFKQKLIMLKDVSIDVKEKYSAAIFVKGFNRSIKLLKTMVSDKDFSIFYNYYILDQNRNSIADGCMIDVTTVQRIKAKVLSQFSSILYSEHAISEMFG